MCRFLALDWHGPGTASLARLSFQLHKELAQEFDGEESWGYGKIQSFSLSKTAKAVPHDTIIHKFRPNKTLEHAPDDTEWLQDSAVESLERISDKETTAQIVPGLFAQKLFEEAKSKNVKYIKGRPLSWSREEKLLTISTGEETSSIPCDNLVIAAGPWSAQVAKLLLDIDIPVSHLPGHSIIIRPSSPLPPHAVFSRIYGQDMTLTPELWSRNSGLVYMAGENTGASLPEGTDSVEIDPTSIQKLVNASREISPLLAQGTIEAQQLCYRPVTKHGSPLVGPLKVGLANSKAFVAAGHGPWGITLGPGTGKVMAELILEGQARSADISRLQPPQPT